MLRARPLEEKEALASAFAERVLPWLEAGVVRPVIDRVYDAADVVDAHRHMEENRNFGKILLKW